MRTYSSLIHLAPASAISSTTFISTSQWESASNFDECFLLLFSFYFLQQNRKFATISDLFLTKTHKIWRERGKKKRYWLIGFSAILGQRSFNRFLEISRFTSLQIDERCVNHLRLFIVVICALNLPIKRSYRQQGGNHVSKYLKTNSNNQANNNNFRSIFSNDWFPLKSSEAKKKQKTHRSENWILLFLCFPFFLPLPFLLSTTWSIDYVQIWDEPQMFLS